MASLIRILTSTVFIKDTKELKKEKLFKNIQWFNKLPYGTYLTINFLSMATKMSQQNPDPAEPVIDWPPRTGPVIQDFGSADPKEIFTDPDL